MLLEIRFERVWRVLRDTTLLAIVRASLTIIQTSVEALALDEQGRRSIVARLSDMLLPAAAPADGGPP